MPSEVSELMHGKEKINIYFSIRLRAISLLKNVRKNEDFKRFYQNWGEGIQFMEDHKYNLHADMLK